MSADSRYADYDVVLPAEPSPKGWPVLAWSVILALVGLVVWRQMGLLEAAARRAGRSAAGPLLVQARLLVAAHNVLGTSDPQVEEQLSELSAKTVSDRFRIAILSGELKGPQRAQELLGDIREDIARAIVAGGLLGGAERIVSNRPDFRPHDAMLVEVLTRLYDDLARKELEAPSLDASDRALLRAELGWFGELALAPAGGPDTAAREAVLQPAYRTLWVGMAILFAGGFLALTGLVALSLLMTFLVLGKIRGGFEADSPYGGVYAETFAVWLLVFIGLSYVLSLIEPQRGGLQLVGAVMLLSLTALAWPVIRGVPWRQVRRDIGWTAGPRPLLEPFLGIVSYASALPLLVIGAIVTILLMRSPLGKTLAPPSHPVAEAVPQLGWWGIVQVLALACVIAPLVEETVFRGVLYRHLREASAGLGRVASVLLSGVVVGFLFAVVHPQGFLGVPPLMGLAIGFALAREWRGTLIPAMVAHGINNAVALAALLLLTAD
jgi:membrane protease YdiL (CAAX protease family)